ncbi:rho guanine nucleotide exchange factor 37 [Ambystoma mexicanum]|uniref:rho guanine nucleotide exchange factor 37 n=1 Tax=Ambystoma mexicanum TaxID=8296 RepID=UPI0037E7E95B
MERSSTHNFLTGKNIAAMPDLHPRGASYRLHNRPPAEDNVAMYDPPPSEETGCANNRDIATSRTNSGLYEDLPNNGQRGEIYDITTNDQSSAIYDDVPNNDQSDEIYDDVSNNDQSDEIYDDVPTDGQSSEIYDDVSVSTMRFEKSDQPNKASDFAKQTVSPQALTGNLGEAPFQTSPPLMAGALALSAADAVSDIMVGDTPDLYLEVLPDETEHIYEDLETLSRTDQTQQRAVSELITTESGYLQDITLLATDIRTQLQQMPTIAVEELLSNTDEILRLSQEFLEMMEKSDTEEQDQLCVIGNLFLEYSHDMEQVYRVYCADYKRALSLLDDYKKNPVLYQEIHTRINAVLPRAVPDLSFLLVKPVQRITKYPLLLKKILESVPAFDRAYPVLKEASAAMEEVNCRINEFKRNKEVATKYVKKEHLSLMDRVSRINTHTLTKKTARLSQMLKHEAGIVQRVNDKEFGILVGRFQELASRVSDLRENVASYLNNFESFLSAKPHTCELGIPEGSIQLYRRLAEHSHQHIFPEIRRRLQQMTYQPLCNLTDTLKGPQQLIKKHSVKLLDYEQLAEKKAETGSVSYEEEDDMNTYRAIHSMLMSDLPRFNKVAVQWLGKIISSFVVIQRDLAKQLLESSETVLQQLPHSHVPLNLFWKTIEDDIRKLDPQLDKLCKNFELAMPGPAVQQSLSPKSEKRVLSLVKKHGPDKIYHVTGNINGSKELDLTLQRGHIVALLQDMDTKGNKQRWLVDDGASRGYVPRTKLQPYHLPQSQQPAKQMLQLPENVTEKRRHSYTVRDAPSPQVYYSSQPVFQTVAGYAFMARSGQEVSLQPGQPVTVLESHDKKGSAEWSLVEANGRKGYVPSSFLVTVPVQPPTIWDQPGSFYSSQHT